MRQVEAEQRVVSQTEQGLTSVQGDGGIILRRFKLVLKENGDIRLIKILPRLLGVGGLCGVWSVVTTCGWGLGGGGTWAATNQLPNILLQKHGQGRNRVNREYQEANTVHTNPHIHIGFPTYTQVANVPPSLHNAQEAA